MTLLRYDDVDGRKNLAGLLSHRCMTDARRLEFVRWCTGLSNGLVVGVAPAYARAGYGPAEAMNDLVMLTIQYRVNEDMILAELDRRVRQYSKGYNDGPTRRIWG